MKPIPTWQALPPFKIGCGKQILHGDMTCTETGLLCIQCEMLMNLNKVMRDTVGNACMAVLERARCDMLGKVRKEYVDLSDVTVDLFEGIEVCDMNGIINQLQDMVKEAYK